MTGRCTKTIRYDHLYLEEYTSLDQVATGFGDWGQRCFNARRLHSALGYLVPIPLSSSGAHVSGQQAVVWWRGAYHFPYADAWQTTEPAAYAWFSLVG